LRSCGEGRPLATVNPHPDRVHIVPGTGGELARWIGDCNLSKWIGA